jgi:hypothetical protein
MNNYIKKERKFKDFNFIELIFNDKIIDDKEKYIETENIVEYEFDKIKKTLPFEGTIIIKKRNIIRSAI